RLSEKVPELEIPELAPWPDYLAFLRAIREPIGGEDAALYPATETRMREFLKKFPRSRKREAALARLAIAVARQSRAWVHPAETEWPDAPKTGGYMGIVAEHPQPFDAKRVSGAI